MSHIVPPGQAPNVVAQSGPLPGFDRGWLMLSKARLEEPDRQPVLIDIVLLHAGRGIALLQSPPNWCGDTPDRLRRRLDRARFTAIFPGQLPILHIQLLRGALPELPRVLDAAFAAGPPLALPGGDAWMQAVTRALNNPAETLVEEEQPRWNPAMAAGGLGLTLAAALGGALLVWRPAPPSGALAGAEPLQPAAAESVPPRELAVPALLRLAIEVKAPAAAPLPDARPADPQPMSGQAEEEPQRREVAVPPVVAAPLPDPPAETEPVSRVALPPAPPEPPHHATAALRLAAPPPPAGPDDPEPAIPEDGSGAAPASIPLGGPAAPPPLPAAPGGPPLAAADAVPPAPPPEAPVALVAASGLAEPAAPQPPPEPAGGPPAASPGPPPPSGIGRAAMPQREAAPAEPVPAPPGFPAPAMADAVPAPEPVAAAMPPADPPPAPPPAATPGPTIAALPAATGQPDADRRRQAAAPPRTAIDPAPAPDTARPEARPLPRPAADPALLAALLRRGDALLALGDVSGARRFYERAAEAGSAEGARAAGRTHDPAVLATLGTRGIRPDPEAAASWYRRADTLAAEVRR